LDVFPTQGVLVGAGQNLVNAAEGSIRTAKIRNLPSILACASIVNVGFGTILDNIDLEVGASTSLTVGAIVLLYGDTIRDSFIQVNSTSVTSYLVLGGLGSCTADNVIVASALPSISGRNYIDVQSSFNEVESCKVLNSAPGNGTGSGGAARIRIAPGGGFNTVAKCHIASNASHNVSFSHGIYVNGTSLANSNNNTILANTIVGAGDYPSASGKAHINLVYANGCVVSDNVLSAFSVFGYDDVRIKLGNGSNTCFNCTISGNLGNAAYLGGLGYCAINVDRSSGSCGFTSNTFVPAFLELEANGSSGANYVAFSGNTFGNASVGGIIRLGTDGNAGSPTYSAGTFHINFTGNVLNCTIVGQADKTIVVSNSALTNVATIGVDLVDVNKVVAANTTP